MSRIPAHRLAVVRCPTCGRRNATDGWRALRGRRARCGRCGGALPRRLSATLIAAAAALAALAVVLALVLAALWGGRTAERRQAELEALARDGRLSELAERLTASEAGAAERARLAGSVARRLGAAAGGEPDAVAAAWAKGDELLAAQAERWPELPRALAPVLERLGEQRRADREAEELEALVERSRPSLTELEAAWRAAAERARRWSPEAAERWARRVAPLWDRARLAAARAALPTGSPAAVRRLLQRPSPAVLLEGRSPPGPAVTGARADPAPQPPVQESPEEAIELVRAATREGGLEELRLAVRVRAAESWGAGERVRLDEALVEACEALARSAAVRALSAASAVERVPLLLEALTCDETLPPELRRRALAALAMAELEAAEQGGAPPPPPDSLRARLGPELREAALARLACVAERRGRPGEAVESLLALEDPARLAAALHCEPSAADAIPSSLDHASVLAREAPP